MPMQVRCPKCKTVMNVSDALVGKKAKCPKCGQVLQISGKAPSPGPGAPAKQAPAPRAPSPETSGGADAMFTPVGKDESYGVVGRDDEEDEDEESEEGATCPNCSRVLDPGTVICVDCGINVNTGEQFKTATDGAPSGGTVRSRRTGPNIFKRVAGALPRKALSQLIILLVFGGGGFAVYWFVFHKPAGGGAASGDVLAEARQLADDKKPWEAYQKVVGAWLKHHEASADGSTSTDGPSLDELVKMRDELLPEVVAKLKDLMGKVEDELGDFVADAELAHEAAGRLAELCGTEGDKRDKALDRFKEDWADAAKAYAKLMEGLDENDKACGALGELSAWYHYVGAACAEAKKDAPDYKVISAHLTSASPHFEAGHSAAKGGF